jgi:hypothetical protein
MRGRFSESEPAETPPHQAELWFALGGFGPLHAIGAREAVPLSSRSKHQRPQ